VYSSDLSRAEGPAKEVGAPLTATRDWRPWGLGEFQGKPAKDVVPRLQEFIDHPDKRVPGKDGESFSQFRSRVLKAMRKAMAECQRTDRNVVIVTHFRCVKLIESWLAHDQRTSDEIDAKVFTKDDFPPASVLRLHRSRGRWVYRKEAMGRRVGVRGREPAPPPQT